MYRLGHPRNYSCWSQRHKFFGSKYPINSFEISFTGQHYCRCGNIRTRRRCFGLKADVYVRSFQKSFYFHSATYNVFRSKCLIIILFDFEYSTTSAAADAERSQQEGDAAVFVPISRGRGEWVRALGRGEHLCAHVHHRDRHPGTVRDRVRLAFDSHLLRHHQSAPVTTNNVRWPLAKSNRRGSLQVCPSPSVLPF